MDLAIEMALQANVVGFLREKAVAEAAGLPFHPEFTPDQLQSMERFVAPIRKKAAL